MNGRSLQEVRVSNDFSGEQSHRVVDRKGNPERPSHTLEDQNEYATRNNAHEDWATEKDTQAPDLGWRPPPMDPIPTYLVESPPKDRRLVRWSAMTATAGAIGSSGWPGRLGANDRQRIRMRIYNTDAANALIITTSDTDIAANGFSLPAGKDIEFFHNSRVYVCANTGQTAAFSAFWEFEIEEQGGQK